ncbi:hypothetical protein C6V82_16825 [Halomonas urumqiensis]|nr:hypothetical protein C6V82_16825 [Halomonas urumqiensis]
MLAMITLLLAAGLAVWLLMQPEVIKSLPMALRVPVILLGIWSLGAGFVQPMQDQQRRGLLGQALSPKASLLMLLVFALVLVGCVVFV